jgi:hypothetical protein
MPIKSSVLFVREKFGLIEHLRTQYWAANQALAENLFKPRLDVIIANLKGEVKVVEKKLKHGGVYKFRQIIFADGSAARYPLIDELRHPERQTFIHPKQRLMSQPLSPEVQAALDKALSE